MMVPATPPECGFSSMAQPTKSEIVRNHLYKSPENGGSGLSFGARFRSSGLKGAALDELRIYNRPLAPVEVRATCSTAMRCRMPWPQKNAAALRPYYLAAARSRL